MTEILTFVDDLGYRRVCGVITEKGKITTKHVINCAGAWAPSIGKVCYFHSDWFECRYNFKCIVDEAVLQWFSTFFKSRTPKLSNLLLRIPHISTQTDTILEYCY